MKPLEAVEDDIEAELERLVRAEPMLRDESADDLGKVRINTRDIPHICLDVTRAGCQKSIRTQRRAFQTQAPSMLLFVR